MALQPHLLLELFANSNPTHKPLSAEQTNLEVKPLPDFSLTDLNVGVAPPLRRSTGDCLSFCGPCSDLHSDERCWRYANSSPLGSFAEKVDLPSAIENLDVSPTDSRDLKDPATQQVTPLNQGIVALGVGVQVSSPDDGRELTDSLGV